MKIIDRLQNPKRRSEASNPDLYRYYAGFSPRFADSVIREFSAAAPVKILDPWNGGGTTTAAAAKARQSAIGFDLNPAMVVVAKSKLLPSVDRPSVGPICDDLVSKVITSDPGQTEADPLCLWMTTDAATSFRALERAIQQLLVDSDAYLPLHKRELANLSAFAAFFYVALFRTVRTFLQRFTSSNPAWTKPAPRLNDRISPSLPAIIKAYKLEIEDMLRISKADSELTDAASTTDITVASSEKLPVESSTIGLVLSSPPYCTRLDYAMATRPELATLGYDEKEFDELRRSLIGTATVNREIPLVEDWGPTCNSFLRLLRQHSSKASGTYYFKNHVRYFSQLYNSLIEISRVLAATGHSIVVVQDSFYKDIHNDLPTIVTDMFARSGMSLKWRRDFVSRTLAGVNPRVKKYRENTRATEAVLCFQKTSP
jgi:hypothetical protein